MHSFCVIENHTKEVNCCAFSNKYFVTCSGDKTIRVYSANTFQELSYSPIKLFTYGVNFVTFDKSETYLASAGNDGKAHLFQLSESDFKTIAVFRHSDTNTAQVCAFSNNSLYIVTGSADGSIALWDMQSKKLIREISGHPEGNVYAAAFTPCDHYLVTGSGLGDIRVWDILTMQATMQTQAHDEGISSCGVTCIKFSPSFHTSTDDPDRCYLMASCGQDNKIKFWIFSYKSRSLQSFVELSGHQGPVSSCCFSPDGNTLASSSFDKTIIIWDTFTKEQQLVLDGHHTIVTWVAFSSDNRHLASTSYDKKVIIWKMSVEPEDKGTNQFIESVAESRIEDMTTDVINLSLKDINGKEDPVTFESWSCDEVVSWLIDQVKLGQYSMSFRENCIDGAELTSLTSEVLQKELGVAPLGHRNKILRAIKGLELSKGSPLTETQGQSWQKVVKTSVKITDKRPAMIDHGGINAKTVKIEQIILLFIRGPAVFMSAKKEFVQRPQTLLIVDSCKMSGEALLIDCRLRTGKHGVETLGKEATTWLPKPCQDMEEVQVHVRDVDVPDQFLCPISREIMTDPVIAADGFTYERAMIESWFAKGNKLSPMSNKVMLSKSLIPNQTLKSLIAQFQQDREAKSQKWEEVRE